jgi:hypothetical protein
MEMGRMKKKFGVVDSGGEVRERGVDGMVGGIEEDEGGHDDRWDGVMRKKRLCRSDGSFLTSKKKLMPRDQVESGERCFNTNSGPWVVASGQTKTSLYERKLRGGPGRL